jgi:hypothetical protein
MNKALLVGIDKYKRQELVGCINDVDDFSSFLKQYCGFTWCEIKKRKNFWATRKQILNGLKWLIKDVTPGDNLFFYYSGHGSNIPDTSGDEIDGLDEAICPYDSVTTNNIRIDKFIIDDEFYEIFKDIPDGVKFIWVSDSCHSGDLHKLLSLGIKKYINVASYMDLSKIKEKPLVIYEQETRKHEEVETLNNVILLSACRSDQVALCEYFNNRPNGVFTYFLLQELKKEGSNELSLQSIIKNVGKTLRERGYNQEPQIYGKPNYIDKRFFFK